MPVIAVIGAQWGDEGKGKIVDLLAEEANMVVRFSGGDNAGHTVANQFGLFKLHLVPAGIFSTRATTIIGNGVVMNPGVLIAELDALKQRGVDVSRFFISDRTHLVMPYHTLLDGLEEESRGGQAIGTTRKGIGPAFADKAARMGIRAGDLMEKNVFKKRLHDVLKHKNAILTRIYGAEALDEDEIFNQYCQYGERLAPFIQETTGIISDAIARGDIVLLEGAQGTFLDPDFGTYPYATSSSPLAGGACLGTGIGPTQINQVLGVFKAYCTRVGGGPLPTELTDETGDFIREQGHEYGTTTGRARRCGWFDAVAARFSTRVNGYTKLAITRLDVLDNVPSLKIATGYELDGKIIDYFPSSATALERCRPIYEELPGWMEPTTQARNFDQLPLLARQYVSRLEELSGCPAGIISVGMRREDTIFKTSLWE